MTEKQFVTFYLDNDFFGINILLVREINRHLGDITPVELAPEFVRGLLNLRGQIVTVIDLGLRLGVGPRPIGPHSSCIILKTTAELTRSDACRHLRENATSDLIGLLVDYIGDVVTVPEADIESAPAHVGGVKGRFVDGVVKLHTRLLVTLKTSELLAQEALAVKTG